MAASSRERLSFAALLTLAIVGLVLSVLLVVPFWPGLTWAFAFSVIAQPLHRRILGRFPRHPHIAAGISVVTVALLLLGPVVLIMWQVGREARAGLDIAQGQLASGGWQASLDRVPQIRRLYDVVAPAVDLRQQLQTLVESAQQMASRTVQVGIWTLMQTAFMLFALFFFFRDRNAIGQTLRSFLPLTDDEIAELFERVRHMTRAVIYGNVMTALIQGTLGGLIFFFVGIPGAVAWGAVMAVLSLVPTLGSFVIWIPAAIILAIQGEWARATILAVWGAAVVSTIDNVLYPWLVGREIRLHTLVIFLAVVGGLFLFGAAGIVLGPVILATTIALLDILRRRTARGREGAKVA